MDFMNFLHVNESVMRILINFGGLLTSHSQPPRPCGSDRNISASAAEINSWNINVSLKIKLITVASNFLMCHNEVRGLHVKVQLVNIF